MHEDYFYKSQIKPLTTTLSMNQPLNKRNSLQACYKSDGKSEGRFEEIERKIEKIEEKLSLESNKQTETELTLRKLIDQVELMKLAASNSMQTTKPIYVKRQGHRKTSLTTSGVPYSQNVNQILNPGAFTCSDESSSGNLPNLSKSEKTSNVVYTYIDNYLKACMSSVEKKLFGKLDICFDKIQSLEAHANQSKTEDDNRLTNSQEIHLSPEESGSDMSVCSEYQVTLEKHKRRLEEMEKLVKHFDSPIVNETIKSVLSSEIKSRHQRNRQLQKLYTCIIEKFLGIIDKWQPNLNNLEINSNSYNADLNGSDRSVNESENNNFKLSQLLLLLHEDLIHLQTKLENEPIKYGETSIVKNAQELLDFRTLAESILVVKISLELKINKLEKQLNLEREKIHTEVVKLKEICDRFKTRGNI
ncbi:unnamed protein product [Schistosoma mattheei]|uniref:Uncharacterized protein n=1 Tax=Schistosoma mattheei TaxID=31246 RepID=A0AA85BRS3_9TREM|nr:unnamed protein product [Schistosoma mattheei]